LVVSDQQIIQHLSLDPSARASSARSFRQSLNGLVKSDPEVASDVLRRSVDVALEYPELSRLARIRKSLVLSSAKKPTRVTVIGSYTTHQVSDLVDLFLYSQGIDVEIHETPFGSVQQLILDPSSDLYESQPDIVLILVSHRDVHATPKIGDSVSSVSELLEEETGMWSSLWKRLNDRTGAQIIQTSFGSPNWDPLGNLSIKEPSSITNYLRKLDTQIAVRAPEYVSILDIEHLAAAEGKWAWQDIRHYFDAKLPCTPESVPDLALALSRQVEAISGVARKCLVLDLDNTLWGGVIGDDGMAGISVGQGDPLSEAFTEFQNYAKALKSRGVLLAVCSKNDYVVAVEPFEKHPEMVLKLSDFAAFVANWQDKATNLRSIAAQLNIGIDSLVFVDDNPAERALVRRFAPEVSVPELPTDPADYIRAVERHKLFETISISQEDLVRTEAYLGNAKRRIQEDQTGDLDEFLRSLNMQALVESVNPTNKGRVVQLVNKSNQFNLTTRRYSPANLDEICDDSAWRTYTFRLTDEFGDNGLISVVFMRNDQGVGVIDTWLMSCRVLKRGVEEFVMQELHDAAVNDGMHKIVGEFIPSGRNGMVESHYLSLGFEKKSEDDGKTSWSIDISDGQTWPNYINKE
jgi:FkbH-like protein